MQRRMWMTGAALATLALLVVQGAAADQSYSDPAGDPSGGAPDVTSIAVANDGAGKITFDISVTGLPAADTFIDVPMNTDLNASTGDEGIDHEFFFSGSLGVGLLLRWNGSSLAPVTVPSLRSSYANGVVHFEVNRADMGNTSGFVFWVSSLKVSGNQVAGFDDAPDGTAVYQYTLAQFPACSDKIDNDGDGKIDSADPGCSSATDTDETDPPPPPPPLKLAAGKPAAVAGPAKAGSAFVIAMTVTRSDGKPFTGAVSCKAKAGAATVLAAGRAVAGAARCSMRLPKGAKGKKLSGSITATAGTASVSKPYVFPIR